MNIEQLYTGCLSQAAYFIESNGISAVIDPIRNVDQYIDLAKKYNSKIKYIFETHFHADFVSGHLSLSNKTGAKIVFGPNADPDYDAIISKDNQVFKIGNLSLKVIHTPGHTLESTSYLLFDEKGKQKCLFTGDTLFLGDVGIPDVAQRYKGVSKEDLAAILYDSINKKIKLLDKDILIYPGHGAGSACGKKMMKKTVDTLENQLKVNYSINGSYSKEMFVKELIDDLPNPPAYFPENVKLNQDGYTELDKIIKQSLVPLKLEQFIRYSQIEGCVIIDNRSQKDFKKGHIPNSIFVGLDGQFAPWVGSIVKNLETKILLVCESGKELESIVRLSRTGFDHVVGYLDGGFEKWKKDEKKFSEINQISPDEINIQNKTMNILDVRKKTEFDNGKVTSSINSPLNDFDKTMDSLDKSKPYYVYCAGGYRSMIACSLMKKNGFSNVVDIYGGYTEIKKINSNITEL